MDVKHVLYRFAFTIYSAIGTEFSENAVFSPYSAFIATAISASISPNDEIYSRFLQYIGLTENLIPSEILSEIQKIIQESETQPIISPYFLDLLNQISKKENSKELAFNYMKKSEQFLMFSHIKKKILKFFPEVKFDSEDSLFLNFSDFLNTHKNDRRIKYFLRSIEIPISKLRKAPSIICPKLIYFNQNHLNKELYNKLTEMCDELRIDLKSCEFPQPAVDQINHSIDECTNGTITRIVSDEFLKNDNIKILNVNSIFFDAKWEKFFATVELQDFHLYNGQKRQIKTMILRHKKCQYFENDNIQVLQLNYACSQYSMVYILNKNSQSVQISNNELEKAIESLTETDVYIEMPRFEAEFGPSSIDSCFPPELSIDANENFVKIIQKVKIGNYEEGTSPNQPGEKWKTATKVKKKKKKKSKKNNVAVDENEIKEKNDDAITNGEQEIQEDKMMNMTDNINNKNEQEFQEENTMNIKDIIKKSEQEFHEEKMMNMTDNINNKNEQEFQEVNMMNIKDIIKKSEQEFQEDKMMNIKEIIKKSEQEFHEEKMMNMPDNINNKSEQEKETMNITDIIKNAKLEKEEFHPTFMTENQNSTSLTDQSISSNVGTESKESSSLNTEGLTTNNTNENINQLSIEIPTKPNISGNPSESTINNRINTATSPTTSSTDINIITSTNDIPNLPFNYEEEEEEEESDEDDDENCMRSGAKAEFLCNHPFLFFVINRHNRIILFMGTITDPIAVDLQPLTIEQRADNFLASIRGEEPPFPSSEIEKNENKNSIWDEIDQIGISPSQPSNDPSAKPMTPKEEVDKKEENKEDEKVSLEAQIDSDLMEYVYEGKPKPKPDVKNINRMFGYESKKKKTFSSFSPWSDVVFFKAKSAMSPYKPIEKTKYSRGPHLPPLPPLSNLSTTNWDELEKELEESGNTVLHSSAVKKSTPKLIEPKTNATLSLRGGKMKKF